MNRGRTLCIRWAGRARVPPLDISSLCHFSKLRRRQQHPAFRLPPHPRGIPTVTLFRRPFTWLEETGRQCSCVFVKITERPPAVVVLAWVAARVFRVLCSALMMLNSILDYFMWGRGRMQCHSCRDNVYLRKKKWLVYYLHRQLLQVLFGCFSGNDQTCK